MKTALVTGSETFGRYLVNPSKWLALTADARVIADYKVHSLVLPSVVQLPPEVDDAGTAIVTKAREIQASAIISFGMSSNVRGFQIESSGYNWIQNEKYCTTQENNQPLDTSRPPKEHLQINLAPWNLDQMKQFFEKSGVPFDAHISNDPGRYSCNSWIYRTLLAMRKQDIRIPFLFVHTACTEEAIELIPDFDRANKIIIKKEDTLKGLECILKSLS